VDNSFVVNSPWNYGMATFCLYRGHFLNIDVLPENYVAVDLGAANGMMLRFWNKYIPKKAGLLYGFEPSKPVYNYLEKLVAKHTNMQCCNMAVSGSATPSTIEFSDCCDEKDMKYCGWSFASGHTIHKRAIETGQITIKKKYQIPVFNFNNLFQKIKKTKIDYLVMDIEGHEKECFDTAPAELFENITQISLECHYPQEIERYRRLLQKYGYKNVFVWRGGTIYACREEMSNSIEEVTDII